MTAEGIPGRKWLLESLTEFSEPRFWSNFGMADDLDTGHRFVFECSPAPACIHRGMPGSANENSQANREGRYSRCPIPLAQQMPVSEWSATRTLQAESGGQFPVSEWCLTRSQEAFVVNVRFARA